MTEITTYKCDVCGKEFTFEDECLAHELKCKTAGLEDSIVMMDSGEEILSLDNWERAIDSAYFVYIANQKAADRLKDLFYEYNYDFPADDVEEAIIYPALFAYQDNGMYWKSLQGIDDEYNELLAIKDEMLDYLSNN